MKAKGFTLIEIILVIIIIGIILAIAVPNYNQWMRKNQIERETRELLTDLNTARLDSIYRKTRHSIVLNPNNYIMKRYTSPNESSTAGGTTVLTKNLSYQISKMSGAFSGEHIVFNTRGFVEMGINTIKVNPSYSGAAFDCIVISVGRSNVGKVESNDCNQK